MVGDTRVGLGLGLERYKIDLKNKEHRQFTDFAESWAKVSTQGPRGEGRGGEKAGDGEERRWGEEGRAAARQGEAKEAKEGGGAVRTSS